MGPQPHQVLPLVTTVAKRITVQMNTDSATDRTAVENALETTLLVTRTPRDLGKVTASNLPTMKTNERSFVTLVGKKGM